MFHACRCWKYDETQMEYFVEDECKSLLKRSELLREVESTEMDVGFPEFSGCVLLKCDMI